MGSRGLRRVALALALLASGCSDSAERPYEQWEPVAGPGAIAPPPRDGGGTGDGEPPIADAASETDARDAGTSHIRLVAVGDTGRGDPGQRAVAAGIEKVCAARGCDAVLLLGDNIYSFGPSSVDDPQWSTKFEAPFAKLALPFHPVMGNHDYGQARPDASFAKAQIAVAYSARSTKWKMPARVYRIALGPASILALDTHPPVYGPDTAQETLIAALPAMNRPWRIAMGHHPYLSNGPNGSATGSLRGFLERQVCGKVDLYLAGHDHDREWLSETCDGTELVVSGAGSSLRPITTAKHPARYQSDDALGFLYLDITPAQLSARFYDAKGIESYARTLSKSAK